jgi:hypothetical protein
MKEQITHYSESEREMTGQNVGADAVSYYARDLAGSECVTHLDRLDYIGL